MLFFSLLPNSDITYWIKYFDKIKCYSNRPYLFFFSAWNLKRTYIFFGLMKKCFACKKWYCGKNMFKSWPSFSVIPNLKVQCKTTFFCAINESIHSPVGIINHHLITSKVRHIVLTRNWKTVATAWLLLVYTCILNHSITVMILSFRTDRSGQIRQSSLIRVYTVCHSVCIFWTHSSVIKPFCSL